MSRWIKNEDGSIQPSKSKSKSKYKKNTYWSYTHKKRMPAAEEGPIKVLNPAEAPKPITIHKKTADQWYLSEEWRLCRSEFLRNYYKTHEKRICACCGLSENETVIHVDHILPVRRYWEKRIDQSNLQNLCEECNKHKGNWTKDNIET
jgi:5-methylcytosine-specific restriction endonuclease McrA